MEERKTKKAIWAWGFDVSEACSGFLYALTLGAQFIETGAHQSGPGWIGRDWMHWRKGEKTCQAPRLQREPDRSPKSPCAIRQGLFASAETDALLETVFTHCCRIAHADSAFFPS